MSPGPFGRLEVGAAPNSTSFCIWHNSAPPRAVWNRCSFLWGKLQRFPLLFRPKWSQAVRVKGRHSRR